MPLARSQTRVHRLFLSLCVCGCLAVGLWPRKHPPMPSTRQDFKAIAEFFVAWAVGRPFVEPQVRRAAE